jgi:hypothetical protein
MSEGTRHPSLDHLCMVELQYQPEMTAITSPAGRSGQ